MAFYLRWFFFNIILQNFDLRTGFWFYFPSVGVRKPLYLIIKEKNVIFIQTIANTVINVITMLPLNGCPTKQLAQISPLSKLIRG